MNEIICRVKDVVWSCKNNKLSIKMIIPKGPFICASKIEILCVGQQEALDLSDKIRHIACAMDKNGESVMEKQNE